MNAGPLQHLADGWLNYHRSARANASTPVSDELFDFAVAVDELVRNDPERAWLAIQLIFAGCRDDLERACLAAGPLEDLLTKHGSAFIERVERAASSNRDFRELLVGVWRNGMAYPVWNRLQRAVGTG
jgi:hypothetical protein